MSASLSPFAAKRVGTLNKFYTRAEIGELLATELGSITPRSAVDLGAGEGSLSLAVVRRWPHLNVTTVDIDDACVGALHERLLSEGVQSHTHRRLDILDDDLPAHLDQAPFDIAVCNPPFYRPKWDRAFARILQAADFAEACPAVTDVTAEILFFAQNLRLVREGGTLALIVPAGLATGWSAVAFRRAILEKHTLRTAIQLPPYSFADTEAHCFILILTKGQADPQEIKLLRMDDRNEVSDALWIDRPAAVKRLDWSYHAAHRESRDASFTLRELGAQVRRGSITTVERRAASYPVFHTGDFPSPGELVALPEVAGKFLGSRLVIAQTGDILMARVDRDLHQKITMAAAGEAAITDCLYRVRLPEEHRMRAFKALSSADGRERIRAVTKGVGARLLGKGELLDLPLFPQP